MSFSSLVTKRGQRKSFQLPMVAKTARVARAGRTVGRTMVVKTVQWLAPSRKAASSYSRGTPSIAWRIRKTPNAPVMPGQDEALVGVDPTELGHEDEQRGDGHLGGDHQGCEVEREEGVAPAPAHPGEGIGGQRGGGKLSRDGDGCHQDAVGEDASEGDGVGDGPVRLEGGTLGDELGRDGQDRAGFLKRCRKHPEEGDDHGEAGDDEDKVAEGEDEGGYAGRREDGESPGSGTRG